MGIAGRHASERQNIGVARLLARGFWRAWGKIFSVLHGIRGTKGKHVASRTNLFMLDDFFPL